MRTTLGVGASLLFSLSFSNSVQADPSIEELLSKHRAGAPELSLASNQRRASNGPSRATTPRLESVRNATHPHLRGAAVMPGDEVVLRGRDLGDTQSGRRVRLEGQSPGGVVQLPVSSWTNEEIRVRIPEALSELGVTAAEASALHASVGLHTARVGFRARIGIRMGDHWVGKTRPIEVVLAGHDLDADGSLTQPFGDDCDDLDQRRRPGAKEVPDAEELDEDCDPRTQGGLPEPEPVETPVEGEPESAKPVEPSAGSEQDEQAADDELGLDEPLL